MLKIGLTGGIAAGKSTVSEIFRSLGAYIIDADTLARRAVLPQTRAWNELIKLFGDGIKLDDGSLDRQKIAYIIFNDPEKRRALESILHPYIIDMAEKEFIRLSTITKDKKLTNIVVVSAALLIESGYYKKMDKVIVVYARKYIRLKRLKERDCLEREDAEKRINSQLPLKEQLKYADFIIKNEDSIDVLRKATRDIYDKLISM